MSSIAELKEKEFFFQLLSGYINNSFTNREKELLKLHYSINICKQCSSAEKQIISFPNLKINSHVILLDPFYLYENYKPEDESKIYELFFNILKAIGLDSKNTYLTYSIKCVLKNNYFNNKKIYKEIFLKELKIIRPEHILIFGRYPHELFFNEIKELKYNNAADMYKMYESRLFFVSSPVEIFYNPALKKEVWKFLKFFRKTVRSLPCSQK